MTKLDSTTFVRCIKCTVTYPRTLLYFPETGRKCRVCAKLDARNWYAKNKKRARDSRKRYRSENKERLVEVERQWKEDNRERVRENLKRWHERNKEQVSEKSRQYYKENCEQIKARMRQWYLDNHEYALEKQKEYKKDHRAVNRGNSRQRGRRYRAHKRQVEHETYTERDLNLMWHEQKGCCFYCQTPLFATYHIEHMIPLSRGGADKLDNICLACPPCNHRKHAKTAKEFMELIM